MKQNFLKSKNQLRINIFSLLNEDYQAVIHTSCLLCNKYFALLFKFSEHFFFLSIYLELLVKYASDCSSTFSTFKESQVQSYKMI